MNALNRSYTSASGEERSRERAVQVSEASTSISAVSSMPLALYSSVNADILRLILSSGHITPRDAALPAAESMDSALRAEMMEIYGSQRNELAMNTTSQLPGNNSTPTQLRTTAQLLYAEALCLEARMHTGRYPLRAARAIPSIEEQLRLLIQEQQAQQTLAVAASNIAASRNASYSLADPQMSQSLTLECLQLLTQQHHQKQQQTLTQTLLDTLIQAQVVPQTGLQAGNYSFGNRARDLPTPQPSSTIPTATPLSIPPPFGRYGKVELFPGKLYRLLAEAERDGNTHIVSFTPDGRAFKINDPGVFIKDVSPHYFRQSLLSSFVRQLNFYGFDRLSHGPDIGAFAHPYFIRGRPELLDRIERQNVTTRSKRS
jgi:hypothetical protein